MYFVIKKKTFQFYYLYGILSYGLFGDRKCILKIGKRHLHTTKTQLHFVSSDLKFQKKEKEKKIQVGDKKNDNPRND